MMDNLKIEFAKSLENTSDEEVSRLSKEQPKQLNEFEEVIRIVKEILESASVCQSKEREIQRIITRYEELTALKGDYMERLKNEISDREIDKHQLFKEKILNVKLAKFSDLTHHVTTTPLKMNLENCIYEQPPRPCCLSS